MTPRSAPRSPAFAPVPARATALLTALSFAAGLSGCVVEEPPGPTTVIVTAHPWPQDAPRPAAVLGDATGVDVAYASDDPWRRAVDLFATQPLPATLRDAPDERYLPGAARTLTEELTAEGFESGVFTSGPRFDETSGVFQGFLHLDEGWLRAHSDADPGPLGAAFAAAQFVRLKIPRPLEDSAFAWLHLELDGTANARATLDEALELLREALSADPDGVLVLVDLASPDGVGALAIAGEAAALERASEPVAATELSAAVLAVMRERDGRGASESDASGSSANGSAPSAGQDDVR